MLETGKPFPNFSLPNQDNRTIKLKDLAGKWAVIYTYPKDDTPGCTLEGKGFTAAKAQFDSINAVVLGVSEDDTVSHKKFCEKYGFGISLLADTKHELMRAMGVGQSEWKGTMYWDRVTFIVDPKGTIRKVYPKVKPEGHEHEVLEELKRLQSR